MLLMLMIITCVMSIILISITIYGTAVKSVRKISFYYSLLFFGLFIVTFYFNEGFYQVSSAFGVVSEFLEKDQKEVHSSATLVESKESDFKVKPLTFEESALLDVPLSRQLPELPRGCEVTSLAMLLNYAGVDVNKMELAQYVKKDETPYRIQNGKVHFGNPHNGFVGDMYSLSKQGYGVYHKPIFDLASTYLPDKAVDITGMPTDLLFYYVGKGSPVWVITNTDYKELPPSSFVTWETPEGPIDITYKEHSVVITGYNQDYIFFNDPLAGVKDRKAPRDEFINAWVQMGRQAITLRTN